MDQHQKLNTHLSLWQVVIIGVAYMTPMTVFDTFGIVSGITNGRVPMAYLLALVAIMLTALSYSRLASVFPEFGSAYTYTSTVCGKENGFFVGWGTLLDYILLPMINSLLSGIYLKALFPNIPAWILISIFIFIVTFINCRSIKFLANLNFLFVGIPLVLMVYFIYLVIHNITLTSGYEHVLTINPLFNGDRSIIPLVSGAAVLCFSFLGFDAVSTLSNETQNARRTIPKAIIITVFCGGVIFFISAWFIQLYYPTNIRFKDPIEAMPEIVLYVGGLLFQSIFLVAILVNTFASALASHASAARLLYIMGSTNFIPGKIFRYLHPKYNSPFYCVILIGVLSLSAAFFRLDTAVSLISFGAMIAFSSVNISVFVLFVIQRKEFKTFKQKCLNIILPILGIFTVGVMWLNLKEDAFILGISWSILGLLYLLYLKKYKKSLFTKKEIPL
ncbi:APC family permease [Commensalibacter oyaizuii]|uniref:APC family permease n=1 Tax=Commensalibacter oyaizuii TaxID=3043873 RepID=A0ABT6Q3T8_9PROT|nr:APC family permease [Commensalibacter sp. TBRC 16381]MDI2091783.1 APC family permease [Commensalibacter sp. TBRC 16381]